MAKVDYGKLAENCLVTISVAATIVSLYNDSIEVFAVFLDWTLILLFFYTRIPAALDSYFRTKVFREDLSLKVGIIFFPSITFFLFLLSVPFGFFLLPKVFQTLSIFDLSVSIFGTMLLVFVSIFYFSWRTWYHKQVALKLWRKTCTSQKQFEREQKKIDKPGLESFLTKYMSPGIPLMAVTVVLFFGWLILSIIDIIFAAFLLIWLTYNLVYEVSNRKTSLTKRNLAVFKSWRKLDEKIAWESLIRTALAGSVSGVMDIIIITGSFTLLILISLLNLAAFIIMFGLLSSWYLLVVLIQLARRDRYRIKLSSEKSFPTLPPYVDLILAGCLATIVGFAAATYMQLYNLQIALKIFLILSVALNMGAFVSIGFWTKRKNATDSGGKKPKMIKSLHRDRYRLAAIFFVVGLPIALLGNDIKGIIFWTALSGSLILLSFSNDIRKRTENTGPVTFATVATFHLGFGIYVILSSALYIFPELGSMLEIVMVILGILLGLMWVQTYKQHLSEK